MEKTPPSTAVPSQVPSMLETEKEREGGARLSRSPSVISHHSLKKIETTALHEAKALDKLSEEPQYPSGVKLAIIIIGLCLAVFLVALVSASIPYIVVSAAHKFLGQYHNRHRYSKDNG